MPLLLSLRVLFQLNLREIKMFWQWALMSSPLYVSIWLLIISNIALGWAASTGKERDFESLEELPNPPTFGISRLGSGSHVMSYCLASKQGWDSETIAFQVLGDLAGLASGVKESKADLFLWEKFTTKPLYDSGSLKYIGEIVAPWLSFIIVTHQNFLRKIRFTEHP
ncbi:hypothetical protein DSO57_1020146 [Entomophthora muscae]|uniref:Uncharacterized protein n=1 Tax=Entomophthora muscae TaxID=34485 RepID=A0ACC2UQW8_9FUNG|nr:hypothetical protein DSO57_1020146 [Entomophthora muscae]